MLPAIGLHLTEKKGGWGRGTIAAMILATKLFTPRARRDTVLRPRLLDRLDTGLAGKLLLISAPAGFGKTTLVSQWLQQLKAEAKNGLISIITNG